VNVYYILTVVMGKVLRLIVSIHLFPLYNFLNLVFACVWVITIARWGLKVKVMGYGQCKTVGTTSTAAYYEY